MYFLMAVREDPRLSFKVAMAVVTISATGGWVAATLGLRAFFTFLGEAAFLGDPEVDAIFTNDQLFLDSNKVVKTVTETNRRDPSGSQSFIAKART